jgi:hypothetical protein
LSGTPKKTTSENTQVEQVVLSELGKESDFEGQILWKEHFGAQDNDQAGGQRTHNEEAPDRQRDREDEDDQRYGSHVSCRQSWFAPAASSVPGRRNGALQLERIS